MMPDVAPLHTLQRVHESPYILRLRVANGWVYFMTATSVYVPDGQNEIDALESARVRRTSEELQQEEDPDG